MKSLVTILTIILICSAVPAAAEPYEFVPQIELYTPYSSTRFAYYVDITDFDTVPAKDVVVTESSYMDDQQGRVHIFLNIIQWGNSSYDVSTPLSTVTMYGLDEDHFGLSAKSCDVNGDDLLDVITFRPWLGGQDSVLLVFYGGREWTPGTVVTDPESEADLVIHDNVENDFKSFAVSDCRDINGDGYDDIFAGSYPVVVLGDEYASGTVIDLNVTPPALKFTASNDKYFDGGFLGDVNGDGHVDYIFGEEYSYGCEGAISIWFGPDDYSTPMTIHYPDDPPDILLEGESWDDYLHVSAVGDYNGDGADDLLAPQKYNSNLRITHLLLGEVGMEPGHEFTTLFGFYSQTDMRWDDLSGDGQLDLLYRDEAFFWDRSLFPQTGNWLIYDWEPQGEHDPLGSFAETLVGHIDDDGIPDAIFHDYESQEVEIWLSTRAGDDDDDDTGDDDTGDDDTGDDDTGDDDTGDDDTGDDDTGDDDTGDDDTGDDDTGDDDTGDDDTGDDDTGDDDDDTAPGDDDDDGCGCS